ncbi:MAG: hypothetical protein H6873_04480 [Hyphomicrobiaceae bacterium]|nr:hypothetical protein [Hyphomicrobiaceae bacterium]
MTLNRSGAARPVAPVRPGEIAVTDEGSGTRFWLDISDDGILKGQFAAPASGWLAVGFARQAELAGTRFLIAALDGSETRWEEHIACPPEHRPLAEWSAMPLFTQAAIRPDRGQVLDFALIRRVGAPHALDLSSGRTAGLMLAYANDPDFAHHSAWRRHFSITL